MNSARLVPDDVEFGQRMAFTAACHDFSTNSGWSPNKSAYSSRIAGLTHASMRPARASSKMSADALFSPGNVASFRMQVSRTTLKIGPGATQCPCAPLGFDEPHRFTFGHRLATVLAVRARQRRGELEPDDFPVDDGSRIHAISVRKDAGRNKGPVPLTQV